MCKCYCCSVTKLCPTPCSPMNCSPPGFPVIHYLMEFAQLMSIESVMPSNQLILCRPLLLLPSTFPSIRVFSNELALCIRWPKYWDSASASVLPMKIPGWFPLELIGLISLLSKGLSRVFSSTTFQSINSSELSFLHGPTLTSVCDYWKNHSFDYIDLCWQMMSLLFNMPSKLCR